MIMELQTPVMLVVRIPCPLTVQNNEEVPTAMMLSGARFGPPDTCIHPHCVLNLGSSHSASRLPAGPAPGLRRRDWLACDGRGWAHVCGDGGRGLPDAVPGLERNWQGRLPQMPQGCF
jgi:hypothetical protein